MNSIDQLAFLFATRVQCIKVKNVTPLQLEIKNFFAF